MITYKKKICFGLADKGVLSGIISQRSYGIASSALAEDARPLTKAKSAVKFFVKNLFKLREIWYNVGIENSVIMGCSNAFGRNKPTNKNGVCMYRGFGTERPYFKKNR